MKTFVQFVNIYCVLLYTIGFIYSIDEFIAFHLRHEFFEGFRVAVPMLIFLFFHLPALLFFVMVKDNRKWIILLTSMIILFLSIFIGFKWVTLLVPNIMLIAFILHTRDLVQIIKLRKIE